VEPLSFHDKTMSTVTLQGQETFHLRFTCKATPWDARFDLCNLKGNIIQTWPFKFSFKKTSLDLDDRNGRLLRYENRLFGGTYFITESEEKRTFMDQKGPSRSLSLDGMKFQHHDFQTHMNFTCPEHLLYQAILVANLLFNPPFSQSD
jgi:hypothetical protein